MDNSMMTRWAKTVTPDHVHEEYPRPQMVRDRWASLNGLWDYAIRDRTVSEVSTFDGKILVPFPVESALSGVQKPLRPHERLWYKRTFAVPESWKSQKILLHFGAVDWQAEVLINGKKAGEHTGGYYPFSFEITPYLTDNENELMVAVWDPTDTYGQERGKQALNPSGLFYTPVSGIWQTVWIEPVSELSITSIKITPEPDHELLTLEALMAPMHPMLEIQASVYDRGEIIAEERGPADKALKLKIQNPKLWSPKLPFLYDLKIQLLHDGKVSDEITSYFAMRQFSVGEDGHGVKRLLLNNEPLFFNGVLDQGYWPDGLYTAPSDEAMENDIRTIKAMGFNMVRKHIKVEPLRWYYHCDRIGLVVWQDMINGGSGWSIFYQVLLPYLGDVMKIRDNKYKVLGRCDKANTDNYKKELKEMIDALYNVPSIGLWVPFNEAWGQFDSEEIAAWLKDYDPTRCIDHASGWYDQEIGDIKSIHIYFRKLSMPRRIKGRTVVISEYGGYSLPEQGHLWREDKGFGYKRFKNEEELTAAYASLVKDQVKPLIEKGVSAVVYTQLTDVETEINGLMTYDREIIKIDIASLSKLNGELSDYPL